MRKIKRYFFYFIAIWCVMCLFIRCYMNLSGFQTGRTITEGGVEISASRNYIQKAPKVFGDDEPPKNTIETDIKTIELDVRYGLKDRVDLGLNMGHSKLGLNSKFNLFGNDKKFAASLGLAAGYMVYAAYLQGNIFTSYHPFERWTVYFSPGMALVDVGKSNLVYDNRFIQQKGANFGFLFGYNLQIGIDVALYKMDVGDISFGVRNFSFGGKMRLGVD